MRIKTKSVKRSLNFPFSLFKRLEKESSINNEDFTSTVLFIVKYYFENKK